MEKKLVIEYQNNSQPVIPITSKFKKGDIVEVLNNTLKGQFGGPDESIGLQGIVTMTNDDEGIGIRVKFPIYLHDGFEEFNEFEYDEDDLKLT